MIVGIRRRVSVIQLNEVEGCVVPGIVFNLELPSRLESMLVVCSIHVVVVVVVCIGVVVVVGIKREDLIHSLVRE